MNVRDINGLHIPDSASGVTSAIHWVESLATLLDETTTTTSAKNADGERVVRILLGTEVVAESVDALVALRAAILELWSRCDEMRAKRKSGRAA